MLFSFFYKTHKTLPKPINFLITPESLNDQAWPPFRSSVIWSDIMCRASTFLTHSETPLLSPLPACYGRQPAWGEVVRDYLPTRLVLQDLLVLQPLGSNTPPSCSCLPRCHGPSFQPAWTGPTIVSGGITCGLWEVATLLLPWSTPEYTQTSLFGLVYQLWASRFLRRKQGPHTFSLSYPRYHIQTSPGCSMEATSSPLWGGLREGLQTSLSPGKLLWQTSDLIADNCSFYFP